MYGTPCSGHSSAAAETTWHFRSFAFFAHGILSEYSIQSVFSRGLDLTWSDLCRRRPIRGCQASSPQSVGCGPSVPAHAYASTDGSDGISGNGNGDAQPRGFPASDGPGLRHPCLLAISPPCKRPLGAPLESSAAPLSCTVPNRLATGRCPSLQPSASLERPWATGTQEQQCSTAHEQLLPERTQNYHGAAPKESSKEPSRAPSASGAGAAAGTATTALPGTAATPAVTAGAPARSGETKTSTAYASRHQAAEQRRRNRINERLDKLRCESAGNQSQAPGARGLGAHAARSRSMRALEVWRARQPCARPCVSALRLRSILSSESRCAVRTAADPVVRAERSYRTRSEQTPPCSWRRCSDTYSASRGTSSPQPRATPATAASGRTRLRTPRPR